MRALKAIAIFAATTTLNLTTTAASADHNVDIDASSVQLLKSCTVDNQHLRNCFESSDDLIAWMRDVRRPNASAPLQVSIGPGTHERLKVVCEPVVTGYTGHISFQGSGRTTTIIEGEGLVPIRAADCTHLSFSDMRITSTNYILWTGGGESRWNNVEVSTGGNGWREDGCASVRGKHYWTASTFHIRVPSNGNGYTALCDESWFYGSEVSTDADGGPGQSLLRADGVGEIHVYGGSLRALGFASLTNIATAQNGGSIHIHGTGIDMLTSIDATAQVFNAATGGMIHANASAYNLKTGANGSIVRINNNGGTGHIHAPYLWEEHPMPPNIISVTGADMAVTTDNAQTHLVIYNSSCASRWFDVNTNACRP